MITEVEDSTLTAINETSVTVNFPKDSGVTEEDLVDQEITLTGGETDLTATYKADSLTEDGKATFVLSGDSKLVDATTYAVTGNVLKGSTEFVAKTAQNKVASEFVIVTNGLKADEAKDTTGADKKVYFTAKDQYGEALEITEGMKANFKATAKKGSFPLAATIDNDDNGYFVKLTDKLVDGESVSVTLTNTIDKEVVATETVSLTAKEITLVPSAVSSVKVSKVNGATSTDLSDLKSGDTFELTSTVADQNGNPITTGKDSEVRWVSSDDSIVQVGDGSASFVDAEKATFTAKKEGTATITAYTANGEASKTFEVKVGQGKLATITAPADVKVTNKATLDKANIGVNAEEGTTLTFENGSATAAEIPVKASDISFEVVAPTGFKAEDVKVEKVTDANGYLTGVKVVTDRAQSSAEKAGDYSGTVDYTVKVKSATEGVADASFKVKSEIDKTVASVETAGDVSVRSGNTAEQALTFKNAKGETLNFRASDDKVIATEASGLGDSVLQTTNESGDFVKAEGNDIITGISYVATAADKGSYNVLISSGTASKTVKVVVGEASTLTSIDAGTKVTGVVAGDAEAKAKYNEIKFLDQDEKVMPAKAATATVTGPDGEEVTAGDLVKLGELTKVDGKVTGITGNDAKVDGVQVLADSKLDKGTYTVTIKSGAEGKEKSSSFTVEVGDARATKTVDTTLKSSTVTAQGSTELLITPKDQYGEIIEVDSNNVMTVKGDSFVTPSVTSVTDSQVVKKDGKVVGYKVTVKGNKKGNGTVTVDVKDKAGKTLATSSESVTVSSVSEVVQSVEVKADKEVVSTEGDEGVANLTATGKDAAGADVAIADADVTWSVKSVKDADGNALTLVPVSGDPGVATYNLKNAEGKTLLVGGEYGTPGTAAKITVSNTNDADKGKLVVPTDLTVDVEAEVTTSNQKKATTTVKFDAAESKFVSDLTLATVAGDKVTDGNETVITFGKDQINANGTVDDIVLTFTGVDQFGKEKNFSPKLSTGDRTVVTADTLTLTAVGEGTATVYAVAGNETVELNVVVTPEVAEFLNAKNAYDQAVLDAGTASADITSITDSVDKTTADGYNTATKKILASIEAAGVTKTLVTATPNSGKVLENQAKAITEALTAAKAVKQDSLSTDTKSALTAAISKAETAITDAVASLEKVTVKQYDYKEDTNLGQSVVLQLTNENLVDVIPAASDFKVSLLDGEDDVIATNSAKVDITVKRDEPAKKYGTSTTFLYDSPTYDGTSWKTTAGNLTTDKVESITKVKVEYTINGITFTKTVATN